MTSKAARFITQLMAEIAELDARIAELETAVAHRDRAVSGMNEAHWLVVQELAALKAQQPSAGVVLPDRKMFSEYDPHPEYPSGWNACLDEVACLNPSRAQAVPAEAYDQLRAELAALKAGQGEAVAWRARFIESAEVVGYRVSMPGEPELGTWLDEGAEDEPQIQHHEPLMTVAQHERIVAEITAPPATGVIAGREQQELEWLEGWLRHAAEPIGQECCGRAGQECCGCPDPVYMGIDQIGADMNARLEELRALLAQSESEGVKS